LIEQEVQTSANKMVPAAVEPKHRIRKDKRKEGGRIKAPLTGLNVKKKALVRGKGGTLGLFRKTFLLKKQKSNHRNPFEQRLQD